MHEKEWQKTYATLCLIWCNLYNFENVKNTHGGVLLLIKLQASKVTLLHGCFSRYLNCTNGTKSQKASLVNISNRVFYSKLISAIVSSVYIRKIVYPAGIYLLKFNNRNTRTQCEICSKLTIKTVERRHWRRSAVFIVNFEHISHLVLVFLLLNLNM